jgi:NodT family efflux transporter outer membrane factor (OMF) lipoprotein
MILIKHSSKWVMPSFLFVLLCGCSSVPQQTSTALPFTVPSAWADTGVAATSPASSLVTWWSYFNDPLLSQLVNTALQANTSIVGAQASLRQSRAQRDMAAAGLWPSLGSSASVQRSKSGGNSDSNSAVNSFNVGLDANWELDIFGANRSSLSSNEALTEASAATLGGAQVSVAAEVALAYIALRNAQARLAIARNNLASQAETLQLTQWRLQAGLVTSLEAEQARASSEQTRAQLPALQTSIAQNNHALAVLTGQPPAALSAMLGTIQPVPQVSSKLALSMPMETLRQRPDVRAAEYQVTSAFAQVAQANAEMAPSFKLGGSLGLNALTLGSLTSGAALAAALVASVSLPLFDGGALSARVRVQQAALTQAEVTYQATVLTALKEVEDALIALRGDRERLASLQQASDAAANAAQLARQRFDSGLVDFQTVLETQRTRLSTQDNVASTTADISADHVRLYKALGGGWNPEVRASAVLATQKY